MQRRWLQLHSTADRPRRSLPPLQDSHPFLAMAVDSSSLEAANESIVRQAMVQVRRCGAQG